MSETVNEAVSMLNEKIDTSAMSGSAKFVIENEGTVVIDSDGARASDEDTDVTLTADADTFRGIIQGEDSATSAFMAGRLTVDGDMSVAMAMASLMS